MTNYTELTKSLRIKADMIQLGEAIAWGSDSEAMRQAANGLEALVAERDAMENRYTRLKAMVDDGSINGRMWSAAIESERQIVALESERDALRTELDAIKAQEPVSEEDLCALQYCLDKLREIASGKARRSDEAHFQDFRAATIVDAKRMAVAALKRIEPVFRRLMDAKLYASPQPAPEKGNGLFVDMIASHGPEFVEEMKAQSAPEKQEPIGFVDSRIPGNIRWKEWAQVEDGQAIFTHPTPDHTELLKMLANRARHFPSYPIGGHIPEVFAALGEDPPAANLAQSK